MQKESVKEKEVGKVTHYYTKLGVAVINLLDKLALGDVIRIKGTTTNFVQKVESMQIEHQPVTQAQKGSSVGLKVDQPVRKGDKVYKV